MQDERGAPLSGARTPGQDDPPPAAPRRGVVLVAVAAVVYALDQVTKAVALRELEGRAPVEVVGEVLRLRLVFNPGAAFGLGSELTVVLSLVAMVVSAVVLRLALRVRTLGWAVALGLLLAGAVGNLTDRVLRPPGPLRGHVIDFLELPNWPVFNVADMAIVTAAGLVLLLSARGTPIEGDAAPGADPGADQREGADEPEGEGRGTGRRG